MEVGKCTQVLKNMDSLKELLYSKDLDNIFLAIAMVKEQQGDTEIIADIRNLLNILLSARWRLALSWPVHRRSAEAIHDLDVEIVRISGEARIDPVEWNSTIMRKEMADADINEIT